MRSTSDSESARRMAQWRATGGAGYGPAGEAGCADDGLQAAFTVASGGGICADGGLEAGSVTGMHIPGVCVGDDGLRAAHPTYPCVDDGLGAGA